MGSLVGAVLLVEVFVRMSTTMLMLFLEEIWSRNLGHLFASPIRLAEYSCGVIWVGFVRTMIALTPAVIVAKLMFGFWIFSFGWHLAAYVPLLILNGCWYGLLLMSLLLRYGLSAEWMAWMGTWFLIPVIAPYYPVAILPTWLQPFSHALPATYVFEHMKAMVAGRDAPNEYLWIALALNILYLIAATGVFTLAYRGARKNGGLLQVGE
jgi:ABC-2 type transport system permease protein